MPLIYKPYQATLANKEGQKLYYPRLVKFGKMVNTQKMAELIAEKASLTAGDVHNVIRNLMSVMREQLLNSRTVRLEGLGTFTMIAKANGKGVELENKVSSSQMVFFDILRLDALELALGQQAQQLPAQVQCFLDRPVLLAALRDIPPLKLIGKAGILQIHLGKSGFAQNGHQLLVFLAGGIGGEELVHGAGMILPGLPRPDSN